MANEKLENDSMSNEKFEGILFAMTLSAVSYQVRPRPNKPTSKDVTA